VSVSSWDGHDNRVDLLVVAKVFTLLTRRPLFKPMPSMEHDASEVDVLLYQMISFCEEFFKQDFLERCAHSLDYFRLDCSLPHLFALLLFVNTSYDR
jgi:hypothetical protein